MRLAGITGKGLIGAAVFHILDQLIEAANIKPFLHPFHALNNRHHFLENNGRLVSVTCSTIYLPAHFGAGAAQVGQCKARRYLALAVLSWQG